MALALRNYPISKDPTDILIIEYYYVKTRNSSVASVSLTTGLVAQTGNWPEKIKIRGGDMGHS